jgi:hypothetical protein
MAEYLFVGGSADGDRKHISDDRKTYDVAVVIAGYNTVQRYRKELYVSQYMEMYVFLLQDINPVSIFQMLLDGYLKPKE